MAQRLYRNLWIQEEVRTLILGTLVFSICFLLELIFLFLPEDLQNSFLSFLYFELDFFGEIFTPLLVVFHLIVWGIMFLSCLMVYAILREYTGGRTGILEIAAIIIIFMISGWLIFSEWFALYFAGVATLIMGYMYLALTE
jgi:hypothetical protein